MSDQNELVNLEYVRKCVYDFLSTHWVSGRDYDIVKDFIDDVFKEIRGSNDKEEILQEKP